MIKSKKAKVTGSKKVTASTKATAKSIAKVTKTKVAPAKVTTQTALKNIQKTVANAVSNIKTTCTVRNNTLSKLNASLQTKPTEFFTTRRGANILDFVVSNGVKFETAEGKEAISQFIGRKVLRSPNTIYSKDLNPSYSIVNCIPGRPSESVRGRIEASAKSCMEKITSLA